MKALLIDDHPLILSALQSVMQALHRDVSVVAVRTAQAAREALLATPDFDIALLDIQLGADDGFGLLTELRSGHPALSVVVIAASDHRDDVMRAIDLGAMGFIPKCTSNETLTDALRLVMSGGVYLPASIMRAPAGPRPATPFGSAGAHAWDEQRDGERAAATLASLGLTPRQTEVLSLLLRGQSNKLIARALNLSVETIKDHVAAVLRALHVTSRTQAVVAVSQMTNAGPLPSWRQPPPGGNRHV